MSTQTTFIFVPGSWHTPAHFSPIIAALVAHGYHGTCVSLPSNSKDASQGIEFKDDVAAVRATVEKTIDKGDVVVIMHSYGGMVGSEALSGLGVKERKDAGYEFGVSRLVYIAAFVVPEGTLIAPREDLSKVPSWAIIENESLSVPPSKAVEIFYNDLPQSEADRWTKELVPQSYKVWWTPTTYAAWRHIPSTAIVTTDDVAAPHAEFMLSAAMGNYPNMIEAKVSIDGGHSPMLSQVNRLLDVLMNA